MSKTRTSEAEVTSALTVVGSEEGILPPQTQISDLIKSGFSEERVLKIGDPQAGGVLAYTGELIGPGADVELNDAASKGGEDDKPKTMPTWQFHPLNLPAGDVVFAITHILICPHQLDAVCKRGMSLKQTYPDKRIQIAVMWEGKKTNRLGQPLNVYRSAARILNPDGTVFNPAK